MAKTAQLLSSSKYNFKKKELYFHIYGLQKGKTGSNFILLFISSLLGLTSVSWAPTRLGDTWLSDTVWGNKENQQWTLQNDACSAGDHGATWIQEGPCLLLKRLGRTLCRKRWPPPKAEEMSTRLRRGGDRTVLLFENRCSAQNGRRRGGRPRLELKVNQRSDVQGPHNSGRIWALLNYLS